MAWLPPWYHHFLLNQCDISQLQVNPVERMQWAKMRDASVLDLTWYQRVVIFNTGGGAWHSRPTRVVDIAELDQTLYRVQPIANSYKVALPMRNHP